MNATISQAMSRADFWALSAVVALEASSSNTVSIPFLWGRTDAPTCSDFYAGQSVLPNPTGNWDHVLYVFKTRLNFTETNIVALMGAHTLGRMEKQNAGFNGGWTTSQNILNNEFYSSIIAVTWTKRTNSANKPEWTTPHRSCNIHHSACAQNVVMLNTDLSLFIETGDATCTSFPGGQCRNSPVHNIAHEYAVNSGKWTQDFSVAMKKMIELGYGPKSVYGYLLAEVGSPCCDSSIVWNPPPPPPPSSPPSIPSVPKPEEPKPVTPKPEGKPPKSEVSPFKYYN
jgi:catalase (peroxidase I)